MRKLKGITLIELLVTSAIMVIVMAGVGTYLAVTYQQTDNVLAINNNRAALDLLHEIFTNDIRSANKIKYLSPTYIKVSHVDGKYTYFKFKNGKLFKNKKEILLPKFSKMKNEIMKFEFIKGEPETRSVSLDFKIKTIFGNKNSLENGLIASFYCRNKK